MTKTKRAPRLLDSFEEFKLTTTTKEELAILVSQLRALLSAAQNQIDVLKASEQKSEIMIDTLMNQINEMAPLLRKAKEDLLEEMASVVNLRQEVTRVRTRLKLSTTLCQRFLEQAYGDPQMLTAGLESILSDLETGE